MTPTSRFDGSYRTQSNHTYQIKEGKFYGRASIQGAGVEMAATMPSTYATEAQIGYCLNDQNIENGRQNLLRVLRSEGRPLSTGNRLVVVLDEESAQRTHRVGFLSSSIAEINEAQ